MKKIKTGLLSMLLLLLCCFIPATAAQAATAKRLFTLKINDGFVTQQVPVYQYTETDGTVYVAAKKTLRTLPVYAGAKTAKITISSKTSLYKNNYKSITYSKKVTLSSRKTLKLTLKTKTGEKQAMTMTLTRPSMPKISSLKTSPTKSTGFTPGNYSRMSVKLNMTSSVAVKAYYKIKNSSGKIVYQKDLGTRKSTNYTAYWDGKPSKGNQAGLSTSSYVSAGTYKLTAYLQYTVGGKNKYISKTVTIKVKKADTTSNSTTTTDTTTSSGWNWKVILSGDDTLDYMVETICKEVLTANMTEIQRARALYTWCDKNLTHVYTNITIKNCQAQVDAVTASAACVSYAKEVDALIAAGKASVDWTDAYFGTKEGSGMQTTKLNWLKAGITQKKGNCLVMAAIYQTLLRHAGIEAHIIENTLASNGGGHHFWNAVKIGSSYYYTDVDMTTYSSGISDSSYTWFLRGTTYFYKENRYKTVKSSKYTIAKQVSASDCPNRK